MTMKILNEETQFNAPVRFNRSDKRNTNSLAAIATPSVLDNNFFQAANMGPINVTNFKDGAEAQVISILGDGNTTVVHGTNIFTNTGANKVLGVDKIYRFTCINLKWFEDA